VLLDADPRLWATRPQAARRQPGSEASTRSWRRANNPSGDAQGGFPVGWNAASGARHSEIRSCRIAWRGVEGLVVPRGDPGRGMRDRDGSLGGVGAEQRKPWCQQEISMAPRVCGFLRCRVSRNYFLDSWSGGGIGLSRNSWHLRESRNEGSNTQRRVRHRWEGAVSWLRAGAGLLLGCEGRGRRVTF